MPQYPWFRLYSNDLLSDRKLNRVSAVLDIPKAAVRGVWLTLMAMANDSPERGTCLIAMDIPVSEREICDDCGLDWETFDAILAEFEVLGMIERGECLVLPNFLKRNPPSDSSAERVRRYRARQKQQDVTVTETLQSQASNTTESDPESDPESEKEQESTATPSAETDLTPRNLAEWKSCLETGNHNKPALLKRMFEILYPSHTAPSFGKIGRIANQMGQGVDGYRRLMGLMWEFNGKTIDGDVLAYMLQVHKGKEKGKRSSEPDRKAFIEGKHTDARPFTPPDPDWLAICELLNATNRPIYESYLAGGFLERQNGTAVIRLLNDAAVGVFENRRVEVERAVRGILGEISVAFEVIE